MERKSEGTNHWNTAIDSISQQFGTISASFSFNDERNTKKKRASDCGLVENRSWRSKIKSLSEEPVGLSGITPEKTELDKKRSSVSARFSTGSKNCRLRFKSPSDNAQCFEKPNYHQTCVIRNNQMQLRSHLRGAGSAPRPPFMNPSSSQPTLSAKTAMTANNIEPMQIGEECAQITKKVNLKRGRSRSD